MSNQTAPTRFRHSAERRAKPRMDCAYPVLLRHHQAGGDIFESQATITNISASGMYLRTWHYVPRGQTLFVMARLSNQPAENSPAPNLAATVEVVRVEAKPDGSYGVAVRMQRHRFL